VFVLVTTHIQPARSTDVWETLIPGVTHLHRTTPVPWDIHVVKVDLTSPRVRTRVVVKNDNMQPDSGETTSSMARRYGALVAINTDYFGFSGAYAHLPQGYAYTDGLRLNGTPQPTRTTLQCSAGNGRVWIDMPSSGPLPWWHNVTAGGPRILRNGVVSVESEPDVPDPNVRNPRTAAAVSQDGKTLILAVCDGRQSDSVGMTGTEMANLLIEMGGYQGMFFDGGGSTTMAINGNVVNHPSDGSERLVAAAFLVIDEQAAPNPVRIPYQTGFENPPFSIPDLDGIDGWTKQAGGNASTVSFPAHAYSQAAKVTDTAIMHPVGDVGLMPVTWIDVWMYASTRPMTGLLYANSAAGMCGGVGFYGDYIEYYYCNGTGGGAWVKFSANDPAFTAGAWHRFGLRLDFNKKSYSVYVDGVLKVSGVPFRDSASTGVNQVRFEDSSGGGDLYLDDLYIGNVQPRYFRVDAGQARGLPDGAPVELAGPIVESYFTGALYAEDSDRSSAMKIQTPSAGSSYLYSKVLAAGRMITSGGERAIAADYVQTLDVQQPAPAPLRIGCRELALFNQTDPLSSIGMDIGAMYVRIAGKITRIESDRFYIDDGGAAAAGLPSGIPIIWSGLDPSNLGKMAVVTGVVAAYLEPGGYITAIRPRISGDVRVL